MASFIVTYDLHTPGQDYDSLVDKIKEYGTHWHIQGSVWIVKTTQSAKQIRDNLASSMDSNDKLYVAKQTGEAAWRGYSTKIGEWLKKYV